MSWYVLTVGFARFFFRCKRIWCQHNQRTPSTRWVAWLQIMHSCSLAFCMWWAISCLLVLVGRHVSPSSGVGIVLEPFDWDYVLVAHVLIHEWDALGDPFPVCRFLKLSLLTVWGWKTKRTVFGRSLAVANPEVHLKAGDLFYLPIFWWHAVQGSIGRNMILNWWCQQHPYKDLPWDPPWLSIKKSLGAVDLEKSVVSNKRWLGLWVG